MKSKVVCHDINGEKEEVEGEKLQFRPSVYGILIEDGKVLLSKQWDGYDFPGGKIDIFETLEETLEREFFEETGLKIKMIQPVHCGSSFFKPNYADKYKNQYWNCTLMYFLVRRIIGKISIENCGDEENNYMDLPEWIEIDKLKDLKFYNSIDNEKVIKKASLILNN